MEEEIDNDAVIDLTDNNQLAPEALEDQQDADNLNNVDYLQDVDEIIREAENGEGVEAPEHVENGVEHGEDDSAEKNDEEEQVEEENNPFADDDDSDDEGGGVQVTIRKLEPTEKPAARQGKLDLDATPMINDKPIYDQDLATMEDRPWRKPGADITDYFNYGFTEETWNLYCERQKKLRIEFGGNQQAANNALLAGIKVTNPLANPVINSSSSVVKVLTDNGGRFKQPHQQTNTIQNEQVIRTVISGTTQPTSSMMDFSRPPPGMTMPPMGVPVVPIQSAPPTSVADPTLVEAPPGIDTTSDLPPGVESAPGVSAPAPFGGGLDLNLGLPPLGFNPNLPPPGLPPMGMMSAGLPPPGFSMPPPQFQVGQHSRAGFGPGPVATQPRGLMGSSSFGNLSDDDDERRSSRRKRSRSRSPRRDRDREDRRDRDSRRRSDRDADRSRRHRSRSTSGDRRRRRDDREREKRRERRDDEDRKKRSRRDDDDDSRRKEKSSKPKEDEEPTGTSGTGNEESPVVE